MSQILVVDDEIHILTFLSIVLEQNNFKVKTAESAENILDIIKENPIDCIICDIFLHGKSGIDMIQEIRKKHIYIPVIFITGQPNLESAQLAVKYQAYDYLTKPINSNDLIKVVKNAVRQKKIEEETKKLEERQRKYQFELQDEVKKKLNELQESETRYKTLLEQTLVGIFVIQDGKFKYINKKFIQILKYKNEKDLYKLNFDNIVLKEEKGNIKEKFDALLNEKIHSVHFTISVLSPNNDKIDLEIWANTILFGKNKAIQGVATDISDKRIYTEREKEFELKLMNAHKLAAVGQLAAGIAHNLNTPISVILGNSELLKLKYGESPELEKIVRQAEKLSSIVQGLLTKSNLEQSTDIQQIDLNTLIASELDFFNANLEFKHNIKKEYNFADNLPEIYAVYSDFSQSVMNLIQNAVDSMYNCDNKLLKVTTDYNDNYIYIKIKDTGSGIEKADMLKLFDPFFTTKKSPDKVVENEPSGTGLGLSTVYNLLTPYSIDIDFKSQPKKGTEVILTIPYKDLQNKQL